MATILKKAAILKKKFYQNIGIILRCYSTNIEVNPSSGAQVKARNEKELKIAKNGRHFEKRGGNVKLATQCAGSTLDLPTL